MADEKDTTAEDQNGGQSPKMDLEDRLEKLEKAAADTAKALEEERRASSGKDKKITELTAEKRKWQEDTLSREALNELRAEELKQKEIEWEQKSASERLELESLRIEMDKRTVLDELDGFPAELAEYVKGSSKEEIETNARRLMNLWIKDRNEAENVRKVTGVPKTGVTRSAIPVRANELAARPRSVQREFGASAADDEFLQLVTEQQQGKAK